jgi:hypothetical protein
MQQGFFERSAAAHARVLGLYISVWHWHRPGGTRRPEVGRFYVARRHHLGCSPLQTASSPPSRRRGLM